MKEIALSQGKVAIVDDEDYEALSSFRWCAQRGGNTFYAKRHVTRHGGGQTTVKMHRLVLERKLGRTLAKGEHTDHINGDGLDNQSENLRVATKAQNAHNRLRRKANPSSQYLGVSWIKRDSKWHAQITVNGKGINLGYYSTELAAAQAREAFIAAHPELYARTNFQFGEPA